MNGRLERYGRKEKEEKEGKSDRVRNRETWLKRGRNRWKAERGMKRKVKRRGRGAE